jgi:hypothetical protein
MMKSILFFCFLFLAPLGALLAQGVTVRGTVVDAKTGEAQVGARVSLLNLADSTRRGGMTDTLGRFALSGVQTGSYTLSVSYLGSSGLERSITVDTADLDLGVVRITDDPTLLREILVQEEQLRVQQLGDTTQYNADAYKTQQNASAEDLVTKMPGITVENGVVKAQGEDVRKVTVDGQEFFGEDATASLRNLPAEIIDKVQVFDQLSDQAQFTGFDDGQTQKTINIVTKTGRANGQFGKVYAGYGTDDRYIAGGSVNFFDGKRRVSLIGLANNVNQQNFSSEDLLGVLGSGGREGGQRGGQGGGGDRGNRGERGGRDGGRQGGGGQAGDYLTGQQNGINAASSLGINYSDQWGDRFKINGSYFFNKADNTTRSVLERTYFLSEETGTLYDETQDGGNLNFNHRLNLRLEYEIDSSNSLSFRPRISFQDNTASSRFFGQSTVDNGEAVSRTSNDFTSGNFGYTLSGNLLYRHKFVRPGRTISLNLGGGANDRNGDTRLQSESVYLNGIDTTSVLDQFSENASDGYNLSANLAYTEPLGRNGSLQVSYNPSFNHNRADQLTNAFDEATGDFTRFDPLQSSRFANDVTTHRGGLSYRLRSEKSNFSVGLNYQNVFMTSVQTFPTDLSVGRSYNNLLPTVSYNYRPSKSRSLRLDYRTSTNVPSVRQLQNVLNNDNPLLLSIGNPDLLQPYTHSLGGRLNLNNPDRATSFMAFLNGRYTDNYIANSTTIAASDTVLFGTITLLPGAQLTRPVNLPGYWTLRSFFTYGLPVKAVKSNLNLNAGYNFSRSPSLINGQTNRASAHGITGGLVWSSNISEKLDFSVSYNAGYNVVENTLRAELDNTYFSHLAGLRVDWQFWKGLFVNTALTQNLYDGLQSGIDQDFTLWNAAIGYRFLKNDGLEIKLSAFDLLGQNNSVFRSVTDTYIEDLETEVLSRYFMLTATYNLRNFRVGG